MLAKCQIASRESIAILSTPLSWGVPIRNILLTIISPRWHADIGFSLNDRGGKEICGTAAKYRNTSSLSWCGHSSATRAMRFWSISCLPTWCRSQLISVSFPIGRQYRPIWRLPYENGGIWSSRKPHMPPLLENAAFSKCNTDDFYYNIDFYSNRRAYFHMSNKQMMAWNIFTSMSSRRHSSAALACVTKLMKRRD